jgi:hypothetical protein
LKSGIAGSLESGFNAVKDVRQYEASVQNNLHNCGTSDFVEVGLGGKAFPEQSVDQKAAGHPATACQPTEIPDDVGFNRDKIPSSRDADIRLDLPGLVPDIRKIVAIPIIRKLF